MRIHRSNRVEVLLSVLARIVSDPPADPFAPEWIVVQGPGMERWVSLELSRELGVFAHPRFPFPRAFLREMVSRVLGDEGDDTAHYETERLMWSVAACLPDHLDEPAFAPLAHYLSGDTRGDKALQLSRRIADTFDHYVIHRPEMILAWDRGDPGDTMGLPEEEVAWQPHLWRALGERCGAGHLAARMLSLVRLLESSEPVVEDLPERVSLFGISTLPPLFVEGIAALSSRMETHLFLLSPSREYWGHIRSEREGIRARRKQTSEQAFEFEQGHPLLASLGRVGREFQEILEGRVDYQEDDLDLYRDPGETSMLRAIQSDMLALREPSGRPVVASDDSISVHNCHGPMREAEVLRDRLIDLFERDASLEARDVVIMTPDVDRHAPFVEAAFAAGESKGLPLRLADRPARSSFEIVEAFARILDVLQGRLAASEVLDLLSLRCIRDRFGFVEDDEPRLRAWVQTSGVRWGADETHREMVGQPQTDQNTWRFGLDRLLLGYAMPEDGERMFSAVRPQEAAQGSEAESLGRLADFVDALGQLHQQVRNPHLPVDWAALLEQVLERIIHDDSDSVYQRRQIRDAISGWAGAARDAGYDSPVSLLSVRQTLSAWLEQNRAGGGFLAGGITLCELVPMRSIPFRVVCLMGLTDEAFPRVGRRVSFDLLRKRRQLGDRSRRDDDRYLFLEALLSARDHLLVTYVGSDPRDNRDRPPSVVVDELLEHLDRSFESSESQGASNMRDRVRLRHPLQSFSPRYFRSDEPRLFSYSKSDCEGARALLAPRESPAPFVALPLPAVEEEPVELSLDSLVDFFRHPARELARGRLGLWLPSEDDDFPGDREPLRLEGLDRWRVGSAVLDALGQGMSPEAVRAAVRGLGILPLGLAGDCAYEQIAAEANGLFERAQSLRSGEPMAALEIDAVVEGVRLVGRIDDVWPVGRVDLRFSKLGSLSELENWIWHLALCAFAPADWPRCSHQLGRPVKTGDAFGHITFKTVDQARARLGELVAAQQRGQLSLLPFFPKTSRKYVETLKSSRVTDPARQAMLDAYATWRSQDGSPGEGTDLYWARLFIDQDPLAQNPASGEEDDRDGFQSLALRVFGPMLDHREKVS